MNTEIIVSEQTVFHTVERTLLLIAIPMPEIQMALSGSQPVKYFAKRLCFGN
jgi:hypothetical protein